MSQPSSKLEITERLIDFGMHSVQLSQIASVRLHKKSLVWTVVGVISLFCGALLFIYAGMAAFSMFIGGGGNQSLKLLTLIPALFFLFFGRSLVFGWHIAVIIAASDGSKVQVPGGSDELLAAVYQRIKQAMSSGNAPFHATVDLVSEKISMGTGEPASATPSSEIAIGGPMGGEAAAHHDPIANGANGHGAGYHAGHGTQNGFGAAATRDDASLHNGALGEGGFVNGAGAAANYSDGFGAANAGAAGVGATADLSYVPNTDVPASFDTLGAPQGGQALPAAQETYGSPLAPQTATPISQLDDLLQHMREAKVPYVDDLSRMLIVVRDHYAGQNVTREDAAGNWEAFRQYALEYLSGVEGLVPLIDRFHNASGLQN